MRTYKKTKMVARNISITNELYEQIKEIAESESMTVSAFIRELAKDYIKKYLRQQKKAQAV